MGPLWDRHANNWAFVSPTHFHSELQLQLSKLGTQINLCQLYHFQFNLYLLCARFVYVKNKKLIRWLIYISSRYPNHSGGIVFIPSQKPKTNLVRCIEWIWLWGRPHNQLNISAITKDTYVCSEVTLHCKVTLYRCQDLYAHVTSYIVMFQVSNTLPSYSS